MSYVFAPGATSKSIDVQIVDDTGLPVDGLVAATFPATYYHLAGANAGVAIVLSDLALITTAWSSGGVKEIDAANQKGWYRLDVPDAALATAGHVTITGEATNKRLINGAIFVDRRLPDALPDEPDGLVTTTAFEARTLAAASYATPTNITSASGIAVSSIGNNVITTASINDGAFTAAKFAAASLNGKGDWNIGKTGYSLTQAFPANFAAMGISAGGVVQADMVAWDGDGNLLSESEGGFVYPVVRDSRLRNYMQLLVRSDAAIATDLSDIVDDINSTEGSGAGDWAPTSEALEAIRDRGDAAWITATSVTVSDKTGFKLASDGLAQVVSWTVAITGNITGNLSGSVGSVSGAVGSVTGNVGGTIAGFTTAAKAEIEQEALDALQQTVPDTVPADGSRPNMQQAVRMALQAMTEGAISGTTWTIYKEDGVTALFTITLNDAGTPTAKTRSG